MISHMLPVIGPILGSAVSIILVIILKGTWWGLLYAAVLLTFEVLITNLILPQMLPKKLRPPYAVTAAVVLIALSLFNVIGAFIAVPVYATLNIEVRRFIIHRLAKKNLPISSEAYHDFTAETYGETSAALPEEEMTVPDDEETENEK